MPHQRSRNLRSGWGGAASSRMRSRPRPPPGLDGAAPGFDEGWRIRPENGPFWADLLCHFAFCRSWTHRAAVVVQADIDQPSTPAGRGRLGSVAPTSMTPFSNLIVPPGAIT